MQLSGTSPSAGSRSAAGGDASAIAKLQKQLHELVEELKGVATSNMEPKAKKERVKLLQSQIQTVQAQIAAIQRARQQEQQNAAMQKAQSAAKLDQENRDKADRKNISLGNLVDTYA